MKEIKDYEFIGEIGRNERREYGFGRRMRKGFVEAKIDRENANENENYNRVRQEIIK